MILTAAPDEKTILRMQKLLYSYPLLSHFSTTDRLYEAVYEYRPTLLILCTDEFNDALLEDVARVHRRLPLLHIVTLTNRPVEEVPTALSALGIALPLSSRRRVILYFLFKHAPKAHNSSADSLSMIAKGLYMDPFSKIISIYGLDIHTFSAKEALILRFIAERYPLRPSLDEIAEACAPYGKRMSRKTLLKHIDSINACVSAFFPLQTLLLDKQSQTVALLMPLPT